MAIFKGLQVEIREGPKFGEEAQENPCEEFRSIDCDGKTKGLTSYQYVCLRAGHSFIIRIEILDTFDWAASNGLSLQIDFDACTRVFDAEVFILRQGDAGITSASSLNSTGSGLTASINRLIQLVGPAEEEELSFMTASLSNEPGKASATIGRHGEVRIAVQRCKIEKKLDQSRLLSRATVAPRPTSKKLEEAGICSKIDYLNVRRRTATLIDVKATNRVHIGQFVFLYRTPDQFYRIKAREDSSDEGGHRPEAAGSALFKQENAHAVSTARSRRDVSHDSLEASTIIVNSPGQFIEKNAQRPRPSILPAELTVEHVLQMQAEYDAKAATLQQSSTDLAVQYLSEKSKWRKEIADLQAEHHKQKVDGERAMQALRDEHNSLQAKIAKQQEDFEAERVLLDEKIQNNKRVSNTFATCASKRTKLSCGK